MSSPSGDSANSRTMKEAQKPESNLVCLLKQAQSLLNGNHSQMEAMFAKMFSLLENKTSMEMMDATTQTEVDPIPQEGEPRDGERVHSNTDEKEVSVGEMGNANNNPDVSREVMPGLEDGEVEIVPTAFSLISTANQCKTPQKSIISLAGDEMSDMYSAKAETQNIENIFPVAANKLTKPIKYHQEFYPKDKFIQWLQVELTKCTEGCEFMFGSKRQFYTHLQDEHGLFYYRCHLEDCKMTFEMMNQLEEHLKNAHANVEGWPCHKCGHIFRENIALHMHKLYHHEEGIFRCRICNEFSSKFRINVMIHADYCAKMYHTQKEAELTLKLQQSMHHHNSLIASGRKKRKNSSFREHHALPPHPRVNGPPMPVSPIGQHGNTGPWVGGPSSHGSSPHSSNCSHTPAGPSFQSFYYDGSPSNSQQNMRPSAYQIGPPPPATPPRSGSYYAYKNNSSIPQNAWNY